MCIDWAEGEICKFTMGDNLIGRIFLSSRQRPRSVSLHVELSTEAGIQMLAGFTSACSRRDGLFIVTALVKPTDTLLSTK
jgi:hypothetical protein